MPAEASVRLGVMGTLGCARGGRGQGQSYVRGGRQERRGARGSDQGWEAYGI